MDAYLIAIATIGGLYVLLALGLDLQYGMTGLINFGHVGFFCVGAYGAAILSLHAVPPLVSFPVCGMLAAVAAWPLGMVSLRLRDDYFAIVSLGFSEVVRLVATSERWLTNGVQGIPGIPKLFGSLTGEPQAIAVLALLVLLNGLAILAMRRIVHSPFGRMIAAIRDNEDAVKALGKSPADFKVKVLMLGAALAGVAGAVYAHYIGYISPDQFVPLMTFQIWMAIIMGGTGRIGGALVGSVLLMVILEGSRFARDILPFVPEVAMANLRLGLVGLVLILFVLFRPQGLLGKEARR